MNETNSADAVDDALSTLLECIAPIGDFTLQSIDALIAAAEQQGREQAWGEAQFRYSADYRDLQADLVAALARAEQAEREVDAIRGREGAALTRAEQAEAQVARLKEAARRAEGLIRTLALDAKVVAYSTVYPELSLLQAALDATQEAMRCGKCGSDGGSNHENLVQQHVWLCLNCDPESMLEALGFADIPALVERVRRFEVFWSAYMVWSDCEHPHAIDESACDACLDVLGDAEVAELARRKDEAARDG